jgi:hypothetical protein
MPGSYLVMDVANHLGDASLPRYVQRELAASLKRTTKVLGGMVEA